jgi:putative intracellular protease/amidase
MADDERAGPPISLCDAVSEAERACVEYAAVGDALGYPGVHGRERLLDAVHDLACWLRDTARRDSSTGLPRER